MFNFLKNKSDEWSIEDDIQYKEFIDGYKTKVCQVNDFIVIKGRLRKLVEAKIAKQSYLYHYDDENDETIINV